MKLVSAVAVQAIMAIFSLWYVYSSYGVAVVEFHPTLLMPLGYLLSLPGCSPGEVSGNDSSDIHSLKAVN